MKEDPLDEKLQVLQGLQWKNQTDVLNRLFDALDGSRQLCCPIFRWHIVLCRETCATRNHSN
jgi:hypothetical protein